MEHGADRAIIREWRRRRRRTDGVNVGQTLRQRRHHQGVEEEEA